MRPRDKPPGWVHRLWPRKREGHIDKKVVLISNGKLAKGLEFSIGMIFGKPDRLAAFGLMPGGSYLEAVVEEARQSTKLVEAPKPETVSDGVDDFFKTK